MNSIGSSDDPAAASALLASWGLLEPPERGGGAWLSVGLDCPPASCTTLNGSATLACPHVHAAGELGRLRGGSAPGTTAADASALGYAYSPLTVAEVLAALSPFWPQPT